MSTSPKKTDPRWSSQVTPEMMEAVKAKADGGRITCGSLRKFAEDSGVPYRVAGAAADEADIRVRDCDLGCF